MQNRIQRLRIEEERAQKNIEEIRKRADEIVSAPPHNRSDLPPPQNHSARYLRPRAL